jgi:hypothetical protein
MKAESESGPRQLGRLNQKRGATVKQAVLFEDRLEMVTSTVLGTVRSVVELDAVESISHVRGVSVTLALGAVAAISGFLALGIAVLLGEATPADLRSLSILGGFFTVLCLLSFVARQDFYRIQTSHKGYFTLFADREPETVVVAFLGAIRRARKNCLRLRLESSGGQSVADEIRKLARLVAENMLTAEEFLQKKRELLELEGIREYPADAPDVLDDDEGGPRSIN